MATRTISVAGGNYQSTLSWTEAAVPTAADNGVATGTSGDLTIPALTTSVCRSFDFTSYGGTFTKEGAFEIGDDTAGPGNVALKLVAGMTYAGDDSGSITFKSTSTTQQTITMAGKSEAAMFFSGVGGSYILNDALTLSGSSGLTVTNGTFSDGGFAILAQSFSGTGTAARVITLSGTTTITESGTSWNFATVTNLTLNHTGTIALTDATAADKTFAGGGKTYNNVLITTGGTGAWTISGGNTFANLSMTGGGTKTVKFTSGTTTTLTGGTGAFFSGTSGNLITISSVTPASPFTLATPSGNLVCDYIHLTDCTGPAGTNYAGSHSTDGGGNTNWVFTDPPAGPPKGTMSLMGMGA